MQAIVHDTYGSTDVLELRDVDKPEIADDEVLVRVHAAGVDRGVWHVMTGLPYPIRLAGYGLRAQGARAIGLVSTRRSTVARQGAAGSCVGLRARQAARSTGRTLCAYSSGLW